MSAETEELLALLDQSKDQLGNEPLFYRVIERAKALLFYQTSIAFADDLGIADYLLWHWRNERRAPDTAEERARVYSKLRALAINPVRDVRRRLLEMTAAPAMWACTNEGFVLQVLVLLECANIETIPFRNYVKTIESRLPDKLEDKLVVNAVLKAMELL